MIRYEITRKGRIIKSYPFRLQAVIYCYLKGFVYTGGYGSQKFYTLDPDVEIKKKVGKKCTLTNTQKRKHGINRDLQK